MAGNEIGYNTKLQKVTTSTAGDVFADVAIVFDISGVNLTRDDVEVSHYGSTSRYRQYIPGLAEGGELAISLNWNSTNITQQELFNSTKGIGSTIYGEGSAVIGSFESQTVANWALRGPATSVPDLWRFPGYVKGISQGQPVGDRRIWDVVLKVSDRPYLVHST